MRILHALFMIAAWICAAGVAPLWAETPDPAELGSGQRLLASIRAALDEAPELASRRAQQQAEVAAALGERSAGTPWAELQQEGVGSGLQYEPNAQTTVRLATPFNYPWQARAASDWMDGIEQALAAEVRESQLATAMIVATQWLELAQLTENLALAEGRLERLTGAVLLQQARLELGEVAGAEVSQLELQLISDQSHMEKVAAARDAAESALRLRCGESCHQPRLGDLAELVAGSRTPDETSAAARIENAPAVRAGDLRAEVGLARTRFAAKTAWGRPEFEVEWERFPSLYGVDGFDAFGARLAVPLPIGRAGRQLNEALARVAASEGRLQRMSVEREVRSALATARGAERRIETLTQALSRLADIEYSLGEQFKLGALSYLAYIDGLSRLDDVRTQAITALHDVLSARLALAVLLDDPGCMPLPAAAEPEVQP